MLWPVEDRKRNVVFIANHTVAFESRATYIQRSEHPIDHADIQYQKPTVAMPVPLPLSLPSRQTKRRICKCFRSLKVLVLFALVHEVIHRH